MSYWPGACTDLETAQRAASQLSISSGTSSGSYVNSTSQTDNVHTLKYVQTTILQHTVWHHLLLIHSKHCLLACLYNSFKRVFVDEHS
jgi:hypothetical protein